MENEQLDSEQREFIESLEPKRWYFTIWHTDKMEILEKLGLVERGENPVRSHPAWRVTAKGLELRQIPSS